MSKPKSKLTFLHQMNSRYINGDKVVTHEEQVAHGDKGLSFKYYYKEGDKKEKVYGKQNPDGTFLLVTMEGDKKEEQTLSREELIKVLSKEKHLKFIVDYLKTQKGGVRRSRRGSKKGSRKSRKGSRRSRKSRKSRRVY
jgi:hypothetical protein